MGDIWKQATYLRADDPEAIEMQWRHFQGFTERCLDASRNKRELKEKGRAAHAADQTLARAIIHGSPDDAVEPHDNPAEDGRTKPSPHGTKARRRRPGKP